MTGLGHQTSIRAKWCAIEIYISLVQKKKKKKTWDWSSRIKPTDFKGSQRVPTAGQKPRKTRQPHNRSVATQISYII